MEELKYEYLLHTWGGFYNEEYQDTHGYKDGYHYFDTAKERADYLKKLRKIAKEMNANYLMSDESEGYNCRVVTTLHRVIEHQGRQYYSEYKISPNYPYDVAKYHLENKWYPGFNDYPLGEDFDYDNGEITIIQEWITGAFDIKDK